MSQVIIQEDVNLLVAKLVEVPKEDRHRYKVHLYCLHYHEYPMIYKHLTMLFEAIDELELAILN